MTKKSNKIRPLKVKESMLSVYHRRSSEEGLYFDQVGKPIIRENYVGEFFMKNGQLKLTLTPW